MEIFEMMESMALIFEGMMKHPLIFLGLFSLVSLVFVVLCALG